MAISVSALIPAYNEADIIASTVKAVLSIPSVVEVVVVDDGSCDETADAARSAGAHQTVILDRNSGKGAALNRGRTRCSGDILLLLDADLGDSAAEAIKLLEPVVNDQADMTIASFTGNGFAQPSAEESPVLRAKSGGFGMASRMARFGIHWLGGREMQSPLAGQRAVRREMIERIGGFDSGFGVEVGLTIDILRIGGRVIEVPVDMVHRASGRDIRGFMHRGRQMMDILSVLSRKAIGL